METIEINEVNLLKVGFTKKLNMYKYDGWWLSLNKGSEWLLSKGDLEIKVDTSDKRFKAFQWWCKENLYKNLK